MTKTIYNCHRKTLRRVHRSQLEPLVARCELRERFLWRNRHPDRNPEHLHRSCPVFTTKINDFLRTFGLRFAPGRGGIPASAWGQASAPISRPTLCEQWWLLNVNVSSGRSGYNEAVDKQVRGRLARGAPRPAGGARGRRHFTRAPCRAWGPRRPPPLRPLAVLERARAASHNGLRAHGAAGASPSCGTPVPGPPRLTT